MSHYPLSIMNLIKNISRLPGIGEKTAERLTMHIIRSPLKEVEQLSLSILETRKKIRSCSICFGLSDSDICNICKDSTRNSSFLCVVEQPADMVAIEKSGAFKGIYHILQGAMSPIDGIGPDDIRLNELLSRIKNNNVKEVVLATSTTIEGEATASYIAQNLENYPVKATRIASGIPIGSDLKYIDQLTIKRAMETRHAI
ncbi:MAG: recombination mediator RecR [Proteobacteria bacterium]|nr:recombination protein RecR [Desulfobacteraceae bacterium]MBU2522546.1 recombination mediator RecR [Pseudomonadota bacterium]MBU3980144.1 recombination mediator RecR [Pseudomonadota bacterium]MBU4012455.1 recombination mediator RecR [Pseudomonadota bacterium]MBU4068779.1 recombination mediator RecR [Pseudomonadota bacterium]